MVPEELDARKQTILRYVVQDYITYAEPVASRMLVDRYGLRVKSATIRNELAEMAEMGYLRQPHTSAGRVPSHRGYRVYVDYLMPPRRPPAGIEERIWWLRTHVGDELDEILRQTCRILASLTSYIAIASAPEANHGSVRQVLLTSLDAHRVLMVAVWDDGTVRHRVLEAASASPRELTVVADALTRHAQAGAGTLAEISEPLSPPMADLYGRAWQALTDMGRPSEIPDVVVEGTSKMVAQPEFRDAERLGAILAFLEERRSLLEVLRPAKRRPDVSVIIGVEHQSETVRECSLVAARYSAGRGAYGLIGVLGPMRMQYSETVGAVESLAGSLSDLLERLNAA